MIRDEGTFAEMAFRSLSRREALRALGGGAVATAAAMGLPAEAAQDHHPSDADLLAFALNLEYLEAEFYTYAVTGHGIGSLGIETTGKGRTGPTLNGRKVNFSDSMLAKVAEELAYDEQQHVKLLRKLLGDHAPAKPAIELNALGMGFGSDGEYLTVGRAMEDTGVTAYHGAAGLIRSKELLSIAAGILADEAYHMGNVRLMIAQKKVPVKSVDSKDILPPPSGRKFFAVDENAVALVRTPREVLDIVYGSPGASRGGFYPDGVNGAIK